MLVLTKGSAGELIVTLNEKRTLDSGYYLFRFENIETKDVVSKIYNFSEDESAYTDRFNKFPIASTVFSSSPHGRWIYYVYEQASSTNTDPTGLTEVERGILKLNPASEFSFDEYEVTTTYKVYAG